MDTDLIYETLRTGVIKFCSPFSGDGKKVNKKEGKELQHKHSGRELLFVLSGESRFILDDCEYELSRGCAVLIDSWMPHSFRYGEADDHLLHLWFYFSDNCIYARLYQIKAHGQHSMIGRIFLLPSYSCDLFLCRWAQWRELEEKNPESESCYLRTPFACLLEEVLFQMRQKESQLTGHAGIVDAIKLYIKSQGGRGCSLEHLEKIFGYNSFHLAHKFKQTTGATIGNYINQVRLAFTEEAMEKGLKQKEIAYELGFASPAAFWKWYRKNKR